MDLGYFICVPEIAFKDDKGVYLGEDKIAVSNDSRNGYIRYGGSIDFEPLSVCNGEYRVSTDLIFVGAAPGCSEDAVYLELMQAGGCNDAIQTITFDKGKIAKSEGIKREDLTKFSDVLLVMMKYRETEVKIYDPQCDYPVC